MNRSPNLLKNLLKNNLLPTLSAVMMMSPATALADNNPLPALVQNTQGANFNEERLNRQLAQWSLQQINGSMPQIYDPWAVDMVYRMTSQMNASVRQQSILATPIINDNSINAFAVPGGVIAINTGTILSAKGLDETASVLAHEVAHLAQRHYEHTNEQKSKLLAMQIGGFVAAMAAAAAGDGNAAMAVMAGSQSMAADTAASHSREHEREADRVGMQILANNGYDVKAMPRFFGRLYQQTRLNQYGETFVPSFVRSHPFTSERLTEATARASSYPAVSQRASDEQATAFDMLYWRLSYLSKQSSYNELSAAAKHSHGAKMAYVAWLADNGRFNEAKNLIATLNQLPAATKDKLEPLLCITNGHIAYEQKRYDDALKILTPCQRVYPERRDLALYLADTLIYAGKPADALLLLKPINQKLPHDIMAWDLTQKAYESMANTSTASAKEVATIHALRARGMTELWSARYEAALTTLTQAKTLSEKSTAAATLGVLIDKDIEQVRGFKEFKL